MTEMQAADTDMRDDIAELYKMNERMKLDLKRHDNDAAS